MRIISIDFENINSLKGRWHINLDHSDYHQNHDIFVICGPTGAGKTTILDSITLALFGRTPRQDTINSQNAGNEVLTRGTFNCYAKVVFECDGKLYASSFLQKKSKNGNFQKPEYIIFNPDNTQIVSNTRKDQSENISKIIKLNYDQFTRSIMLAQGEFNTFLKSKSEDRAAILEKLTGTTKYKKIAILIVEEYTKKKNEYEALQKEKKDKENSILDNLQIAELSNKITKIQKQKVLFSKKIKQIEDCLDWYKKLEKLREKKELCEGSLIEIKNDRIGFKTNLQILEKAEYAKNCNEAFATYNSQKNLLDENVSKIKDALITKEKIYENYKNNKFIISKLKTEYKRKSLKYKELLPKINETIKIDERLNNLQENCSDLIDLKIVKEDIIKQNEKNKEIILQRLSGNETRIKFLKQYIDENINDKNINTVLPKIQTLSGDIPKYRSKIEGLEDNNEDLKGSLCDLKKMLDEENEKYVDIQDKLKNYINQKYLIISLELQKKLKNNKPCPVCGSLVHPVKKSKSANCKNTDLIINTLSGLQIELEKSEKKLNKLKSEIKKSEDTIKNNNKNISEIKNEIKHKVMQINKLLCTWDLVSSEKNIISILNKLEKRREMFEKYSDEINLTINDNNINKVNLENIQNILDKTNKEYQQTNKKINQIKTQLDNLIIKRKELFGTKDVELINKSLSKEIDDLQKEINKQSPIFDKRKNEYDKIVASINNLNSENKELKLCFDNVKKEFDKVLMENGFNDVTQYLKCKITTTQIKELKKTKEKLDNEFTIRKTQFIEAEKNYKDCLKEKKDIDSVEELKVQKDEIIKQVKSNDEILLSLNTQKQVNDENVRALQNIQEKITNINKEYLQLKQMKEWLGKKDGSDFSVFVQSLAFNSLLNYTNTYLFGITARYRLGQKDETDLNFVIHDINYIEPRSITNLSGGEQFLVSLSLALGIAKYASHTVKVDSLFLDEGFGTLSGKLLIEAVNALKQLQKDGKMLGVITHVQSVINEIDQRIEVIPQAGGYSILKGAGITKLES